MGASQSSSDILQESLTQVSLAVMNSVSSSMTSSITQSNELTIDGTIGGDVSNNTQSNTASINMQAVIQSSQSGQLQTELLNKLSQEVKQKSSTLGYSASDVKVKNVIKNVIENKITNESLTKLSADINQSNKIIVTSSGLVGGSLTNNLQSNKAETIITFMSGVSTDIVSQLKATNAISGSATQVTSNPISDIAESAAQMFSGMMNSAIFLIIIICFVFLAVIYMVGPQNILKILMPFSAL